VNSTEPLLCSHAKCPRGGTIELGRTELADGVALTVKAFLSIEDIARLLDVSRDTVYKWSARGWPSFPKRAIPLPNGSVRVDRSSFEEWVTFHTRER
jgi:excisionase family DNA binding protein